MYFRRPLEIFREKDEARRVFFSYDVVFVEKNNSKVITSFDDLKKTSTAMEANAIMGCGLILVLILVVGIIFRRTFTRTISSAPSVNGYQLVTRRRRRDG